MRQTNIDFSGFLDGYFKLCWIKAPHAIYKNALALADNLDKSAGGRLSAVKLPLSKIMRSGLKAFAYCTDGNRDSWDQNDILYSSRIPFSVLTLCAAVMLPVWLNGVGVLSAAAMPLVYGAAVLAFPPLVLAVTLAAAAVAGVAASSTWGLLNGIINVPNGVMNTLDTFRQRPAPQAPVAQAPQQTAAPSVPQDTGTAEKIDYVEYLKNTATAAEQSAFFRRLKKEFPDRFKAKVPSVSKQTEFTTPTLDITPSN